MVPVFCYRFSVPVSDACITAADLVMIYSAAFHSQTTEFTVHRCMDVLDMCFKVDARHWLITLLTQHYVPLTVHLVDHKVALGNISLATFTIITDTDKCSKTNTIKAKINKRSNTFVLNLSLHIN